MYPIGEFQLYGFQAGDFSAFGKDFADPDAPVDFDVKVEKFLALLCSERHFRKLFQHKEFHMRRTAFPGSDGAIQCRRAAANNGHTPVKVMGRWVREQVHHLGAEVLVFDAEFDGFPQPGGDADSLVTLFEQKILDLLLLSPFLH